MKFTSFSILALRDDERQMQDTSQDLGVPKRKYLPDSASAKIALAGVATALYVHSSHGLSALMIARTFSAHLAT